MMSFTLGLDLQDMMLYLLYLLCGVIALFAYLRTTAHNGDKDATPVSGDNSITNGSDESTDTVQTELLPESLYEIKPDFEKNCQFVDKEEIAECFETSGMMGLRKLLEKKVDGWKSVPLRIGVTGRSGVGKSTFINTIRGVTAESEYAAETGVTETTMNVKEYRHPKNKQLVLCDLPGVGTDTFPRSTYLTDEKIGFDKFDMFIILTSNRIFEDDIWLAQTAKQKGKAYLFIRTQIDIDIEKEKKAKPNKYKTDPDAEKDLEDDLRSEIEKSLAKGDVFVKDRVFLIDCTDLTWKKFDFEQLMTRVLTDFPALKRDAFIMSLTAGTPALIKEKVKVLRKRVFYVSSVSAMVGAVPVPGMSILVDTSLVTKEAHTYRHQLGMTEDQLKEVAENLGVSIETLKKTTNLRSQKIAWTGIEIVKAFSALAISKGIEEASKAIPIIGSFVSGTCSFWSTRYILHAILDMLEADALELDKYMRVHVTSV